MSTRMFEHGIVGQTVPHAHLHIVPGDLDGLTMMIDEEFHLRRDYVDDLVALGRLWRLEGQRPYLLWSISTGYRVVWDPPAARQYFRLRSAELLGRPVYGDWKAVHADPATKAEDLRLIADTTRRLRKLL